MGVLLGLWLGLTLLLLEMLPLVLALTPVVREPVGEAVTVLLLLRVELGVAWAVPVAL